MGPTARRWEPIFMERRFPGEIGRIGLEASQMATLGPPQRRIHGGRYFR
jgi:hypothetical protein